MNEQDVAPGEDAGSAGQLRGEGSPPPPAGDLQSDEARGADVPEVDTGSGGGGRDDVPVFEDPNDR